MASVSESGLSEVVESRLTYQLLEDQNHNQGKRCPRTKRACLARINGSIQQIRAVVYLRLPKLQRDRSLL